MSITNSLYKTILPLKLSHWHKALSPGRMPKSFLPEEECAESCPVSPTNDLFKTILPLKLSYWLCSLFLGDLSNEHKVSLCKFIAEVSSERARALSPGHQVAIFFSDEFLFFPFLSKIPTFKTLLTMCFALHCICNIYSLLLLPFLFWRRDSSFQTQAPHKIPGLNNPRKLHPLWCQDLT